MRRGEIYELRTPRATGHEIRGPRLGVVVQSDALLPRSVVLIAPTSRSARAASYRPDISVGGEVAKVLVEQVGAVDVSRLGKHAGDATVEEMWAIDESLATVLALR